MASRVQDAAFLVGAVIAVLAFGLLIVLTRPAGQATTATSPSPAIASFSAIPSIVSTTQAPVTSAPTPTTPAPTTALPTATPAPRTPTPPPLPSASR
jgi:hypothetical protein